MDSDQRALVEDPLVVGFLTFSEKPNPGKKTAIINVTSTTKGIYLGQIRWYGAWRQYVFYPANDTLFNAKCMQDILSVVRGVSLRQRNRRKLTADD